MKNLSITLLILSSLIFSTSAFAQSKQSKNRKNAVTTTRSVRNVGPNKKVVKVKTVRSRGKAKQANKYRPTPRNSRYNNHKKPKYGQNHKWNRRSKSGHYGPRYVVGKRYSSLPRKAVRVVRHGRVQYFAHNTFFRPVYRRGHKHFVVVF